MAGDRPESHDVPFCPRTSSRGPVRYHSGRLSSRFPSPSAGQLRGVGRTTGREGKKAGNAAELGDGGAGGWLTLRPGTSPPQRPSALEKPRPRPQKRPFTPPEPDSEGGAFFNCVVRAQLPLWCQESRHDRPARSSSWANLFHFSPSCESRGFIIILLVQQLSIRLHQYCGYFPTLAPVDCPGSPLR